MDMFVIGFSHKAKDALRSVVVRLFDFHLLFHILISHISDHINKQNILKLQSALMNENYYVEYKYFESGKKKNI